MKRWCFDGWNKLNKYCEAQKKKIEKTIINSLVNEQFENEDEVKSAFIIVQFRRELAFSSL